MDCTNLDGVELMFSHAGRSDFLLPANLRERLTASTAGEAELPRAVEAVKLISPGSFAVHMYSFESRSTSFWVSTLIKMQEDDSPDVDAGDGAAEEPLCSYAAATEVQRAAA